ncbi:hypothetical protein GCM10010295_10560 [Streptomyces intermedius]
MQSYTRTRIGADGPIPAPPEAERTLTEWEYYPTAVGHALRHTAEVVGDVPLIVTENGIATADDERRTACYTGALGEVAAAIENGLRVEGYLAWSALDNYESGQLRMGAPSGRPSASSPSTGRPSSAPPVPRPSGSARWGARGSFPAGRSDPTLPSGRRSCATSAGGGASQ